MKTMKLKLSDFGLKEGINEVIGITFGTSSADLNLNAAPLGLMVKDDSGIEAEVRLYPNNTNHTRENFEKSCELWVNVIHDPVLFVICAFDDPGKEWYESFDPPILKGALTVCRFSGKLEKGSFAKLRLEYGKVIRSQIRAVNRGFNLLIEALIYATRLHLNPSYASRILELGRIIEKCGGKREKEALLLLKEYIRDKLP
jgi:hypothetical protein